MKNLLFTSMLAQASSLYDYSSSITSAANMQNEVMEIISGVVATIMTIISAVPVIIFVFAFFLIIKANLLMELFLSGSLK